MFAVLLICMNCRPKRRMQGMEREQAGDKGMRSQRRRCRQKRMYKERI